MKRKTTSTNKGSDNVTVLVHSVEDLKEKANNWDGLSKQEKLKVVRKTKPNKVIKEHNTTVDGLNEYIVDNLDLAQNTNKNASHLKIGNGGGSGTSSTDSSLNSLVNTFSVTNTTDKDKDLFTSTFIDSTEANNNDLDEVGLTTASSGGILLNHATFSSAVSKDNTKTLTVDVTLEFRSA